MATGREWADAYLAQSREDLAAARAVGSAAPSTAAMVWQMVFEKMAKAALLRQRSISLEAARTTHKAASRMLHAIRIQRNVARALGGTKAWEDVLWLIEALERAHPQLAQPGTPQLEYPWEHSDGTIRWPARDLHVAKSLGRARNNLGPRVERFATLLERSFHGMFP